MTFTARLKKKAQCGNQQGNCIGGRRDGGGGVGGVEWFWGIPWYLSARVASAYVFGLARESELSGFDVYLDMVNNCLDF